MQPIFARIYKVDEATRTVYGRAAQEVVDRDNELFDYASSKPEFQKWSAEVFADTQGKSYGNVRSMHGNIAAGKLTEIDFLDSEMAIDVAAKIVDNNEWEKCMEGVHTGFSIGGRYARKWSEPINGRMVTRYTAVPSEISIVDRPCIPTAKFFSIHKRDGSVVEKAFVIQDPSRFVVKGGKLTLLKEFTMPATATTGIQDYDQEGARRKKARKAADECNMDEAKKVKKPARGKPTSQGNQQSSNGDTVAEDNQDTDSHDDGASQDGSQDDELSAKRNKTQKASPKMTARQKDPNADDAFDTDPNDAQSYGKTDIAKIHRPHKVKSDGKWKVVDTDGHVYGTHGSESDANRQLAALYANKSTGILNFNEEQLAKFFDAHAEELKGSELIKGIYDVASLASVIQQLHGICNAATVERKIEGDASTVPDELRDAAANLLDVLSTMAEEESQELQDGTTAEDVINDTLASSISAGASSPPAPAIYPGLYCADVSEFAKALRASLFAGEDLMKVGARNSKKDMDKIQLVHDAACELGASCGSPHDKDGNDVTPGDTMKVEKGGPGSGPHAGGGGGKPSGDKKFKAGDKVKDKWGNSHEVLMHHGVTVTTTTGRDFHPSNLSLKMSKVNQQENDDMAQVTKKDTISAEGDKRGAAVSDPSPGTNSDNATTDENKDTRAADYGASNKASKKKARMDADADEDDDDDDDEDFPPPKTKAKKANKSKKRTDADMDDDDDDDDDEDFPPPKQKAKKSIDVDDLAKAVATAMAAAMPAMLTAMAQINKGDGTKEKEVPAIPRVGAQPNLMVVNKDGNVGKLQSVDMDSLRKSVKPAQCGPLTKWVEDPDTKMMVGDNDTATLIKAIHQNGAFRLSPFDIPKD